jgi:dihydropyrimidine dehydrogenase (NADP+)/dihydropyrimidine dehydrogenase (NAD+) subunit PreA
MKSGYGIVRPMQEQLLAFMEKHKFERIEDFKGHSLQFFTTHADLVKRQADARAAKKAAHEREKMIRADAEWDGEDFVKQTDALARG